MGKGPGKSSPKKLALTTSKKWPCAEQAKCESRNYSIFFSPAEKDALLKPDSADIRLI